MSPIEKTLMAAQNKTTRTHFLSFFLVVGTDFLVSSSGGMAADILSSGGTLVSSTTCIGTERAGFVS